MMIHFLVVVFIAQMLDPQAAVRAYTSSDPNNTDRLALATPSGRYAISMLEACDGLVAGQNILIYPSRQLPPWLTVSALDVSAEDGCVVRLDGQMDATPCFMDDAGECDVAQEQ